MLMRTFGPVPADEQALRATISQRLDELTFAAQLVVVYFPIDADVPRLLEVIGELTPVPVVGASTGGVAFTEEGSCEKGIVGAFLGAKEPVEIALATGLRQSVSRAVRRAVWSLQGGADTVLLWSDPFACDGSEVLDALAMVLPEEVTIIGGSAGDAWRFTDAWVVAEGRVHRDALVLVGLNGGRRPRVDVLHGFCVADGARDHVITKVAGNLLQQLDFRPAAEVYAEELVRLGLMKPREAPTPQLLARYELGVATPFGERLKIRAPLAVAPDGSITLAAGLRQGDVVRVVTTSAERMVDAAHTLRASVSKGESLQGALVFDCAARHQLLGPRYREQVQAFVREREAPVLGLSCYGEYARFAGSFQGFHNTTAVMAGWCRGP